MIKDIRYGGVSAVPSAYDSPDGDLDLSLNMIHEDGALRPIDTPAPVLRLDPNMRVAFIHTTSGYTHYIVRDLSSPQLFWIDPSEIDSDTLRPIIPRLIGSLPSGVVRQVTAMGNTLIVLTPSGMFYFLWQDDTKAYAALGSRIPFPEISFALGVPEVDEPPSFNVTLSIPDSLKSYVQNTWNPDTGLSGGRRPVGPAARYQSAELSALIQAASNAVYAGLNAFLAESADNGRFTEPFFIRYALRMFDGSHTMHSAPVLMIPNSAAPRLPYIVASDSDGSFSANTRIYHKACSLFFRILSDSISQWSDIITHIDFYVTPPIYTFDQNGTVDPCHADHSASGGFSHFGVYSSGNSASGSGGSGTTDPGDSGSGDSGSGDSGSESGGSGGPDTPKDPFNYHRKPVNPVADASYSFPDGNMERKLSQGSTMVWNISSRKASVIEDDILSPSASLFYLVSSVELAKVAPMTAFSYLPIEERSLANLPVRPRLEDDYQSHHSIIPSTAYPFNSRLNIAGVSISPFPGFPLHSMAQCCIPAEGSIQVSLTFHVRLRRSGMSLWTTLPSGSDTFPKAWLDSFFPRFLFYPDSSAVEMVIELIADGAPSGYWTLPLSSHPTLEGAYWFRGLGKSMPEFTAGQWDEEVTDNALLPVPSKIYTSEVNNPFLFPLSGINTVGSGEVIAMRSAAKALSQGQFGQFPLYAFTTDGIWALRVNSDGSYSGIQPVSREVCLSPKGITQLDDSVLFTSTRGIMLLAGSQVQCISDSVASDIPLDPVYIPSFTRLLDLLFLPVPDDAQSATDCGPNAVRASSPEQDDPFPSLLPFSEFLPNCRMAYDYAGSRIIAFNPSLSYVYVYSLKSRKWGMMQAILADTVNSYPDALVCDFNGVLYNLSASGSPMKSLLLTRPLKLDAPDTLKTVDTVIQRGFFRDGNVASVLYASRDLRRWELVASSVSHFIANRRGTPYKYFRLALLCSLSPGESVSGCSVSFSPRLTGRLR